MEMEGRGFSDLLRNTSEEIFLKTMMENPIGIPAPSMEMLGFRNISQSFRGDSEELFNSWLSNGEISSYGSSAATHRTRQASRRISTELALSQQNEAPFLNLNTIDEYSNDQEPHSQRKEREKEMQASNLYLAKAWFNSSQPMTRSRSSELRRRYAATQSSQLQTLPQAPRNIPAHGATKMQLDFTNTNNFFDVQSNQMHSFMSSSNSSLTFNATPVTAADTVSSVVSMLRGTLQRKKLNNLNEVVPSLNHDQALGNHANLTQVEAHVRPTTEGFPTRANQVHIGAPSQEPSQSGSSTADPTLSNGFEVCDDPAYSGQDFKGNDYRDMMFRSSFNDARKKPNLLRMGSISSAPSDDKADPTKKRRVERSRKMAEAKEKSCTPLVSSNMQSIMKRCANLEKEVRSLKLNLSFMNRKDSEQTKEIEELQKQYAELANEKEWLLGEIERKRMKRSGF